LVFAAACSSSSAKKEYMWVSAPQVGLRDRVATLYNKTGIVHNAERVEVLERQKRFARVRSAGGEEGWIELRHLVDERVFNGFQKMVDEARPLPIVGVATTRNSTNMHLTPARDADVLYQMHEGEKLEILKRAVSARPVAGGKRPEESFAKPAVEKIASATGNANNAAVAKMRPAIAKGKNEERKGTGTSEPIMEDWWMIRNTSGRVGWVLGRMLDLDVPLDIAQYAEGQRIVSCSLINAVQDGDKKVGQWVALVTDPKDGLPYDFNQIRVFTWNLKRHRYETAYRERKLFGMLPVKVDRQEFGNEGVQPTFTIQVQDANGQDSQRTYRLAGTMVRRVVAEEPTSAAADRSSSVRAPARHSRRRRS
jgi:SH3-like domain-containing protein